MIFLYGQDSFFTLSGWGQVGLALISLTLAVLVVTLCWVATKGRRLAVSLVIGALIVIAFEWLSPQIYYVYYWMIFDLPWQIVIKYPPTPTKLFSLLTFTGQNTLSDHGRALLGWAVMLVALRSGLQRIANPVD